MPSSAAALLALFSCLDLLLSLSYILMTRSWLVRNECKPRCYACYLEIWPRQGLRLLQESVLMVPHIYPHTMQSTPTFAGDTRIVHLSEKPSECQTED
jgi:hypothetical protein